MKSARQPRPAEMPRRPGRIEPEIVDGIARLVAAGDQHVPAATRTQRRGGGQRVGRPGHQAARFGGVRRQQVDMRQQGIEQGDVVADRIERRVVHGGYSS